MKRSSFPSSKERAQLNLAVFPQLSATPDTCVVFLNQVTRPDTQHHHDGWIRFENEDKKKDCCFWSLTFQNWGTLRHFWNLTPPSKLEIVSCCFCCFFQSYVLFSECVLGCFFQLLFAKRIHPVILKIWFERHNVVFGFGDSQAYHQKATK